MQFTDVSQKVIFSRSDIIDSFDTPAAFRYWIDKSMSDNLIKRVKRDMYAVVNPTTGNIYANKYLIACASAPAAYLIYHSAIEYHGLSNQVYHTLYVAAEQRFQNFEYNDIEYVYTQSPFAGQIKTVDYGAKLRVTNKERTIVDCIANLKMSGGIEEVMNALEYMCKLDETRLKDCLNAYDNGFLITAIRCRKNRADTLRSIPVAVLPCDQRRQRQYKTRNKLHRPRAYPAAGNAGSQDRACRSQY